MLKSAVSVTLDADNILWLRSQTAAAKTRSLSESLNQLVTDARVGGRVGASTVRSVVGSIDISEDDPGLDKADAHIQELFHRSAQRPMRAREGSKRPRRG